MTSARWRNLKKFGILGPFIPKWIPINSIWSIWYNYVYDITQSNKPVPTESGFFLYPKPNGNPWKSMEIPFDPAAPGSQNAPDVLPMCPLALLHRSRSKRPYLPAGKGLGRAQAPRIAECTSWVHWFAALPVNKYQWTQCSLLEFVFKNLASSGMTAKESCELWPTLPSSDHGRRSCLHGGCPSLLQWCGRRVCQAICPRTLLGPSKQHIGSGKSHDQKRPKVLSQGAMFLWATVHLGDGKIATLCRWYSACSKC